LAGTATFDQVSLSPAGPDLPPGWSQADIGGPTLVGSGSVAGNTWTVAGGGHDIWNDTDQFHYVYRDLPGDGTIVARVLSQGNTSDWAKSGIMIKQAPQAMSPYVALFLSPANGVHVQAHFHDDHDGGAAAAPTWLKLTRVGDTVTAYRSADGLTWTQLTTATLTGPATIGLFVTSYNGSVLNTSTFDQVTVS
jgi:hypothetical protein